MSSLQETLSKELATFVGRIVGPPADALGGLLGDQLKSWRAANLDRIARKWMRIREKRGISEAAVRVLPFGDAYRFFEAASMEEAESVQELWARLLACATDSTGSVSIEKRFIDLLKSLSNSDAKVLSAFFEQATKVDILALTDEAREREKTFAKRTVHDFEDVSNKDVQDSIENLVRLGVLGLVVSYPMIFGEIASDATILQHVRALKRQQIADSLVKINDTLNALSGWACDEAYDQLNAGQIILYALGKYSFTPLGFDLLNACSNE